MSIITLHSIMVISCMNRRFRSPIVFPPFTDRLQIENIDSTTVFIVFVFIPWIIQICYFSRPKHAKLISSQSKTSAKNAFWRKKNSYYKKKKDFVFLKNNYFTFSTFHTVTSSTDHMTLHALLPAGTLTSSVLILPPFATVSGWFFKYWKIKRKTFEIKTCNRILWSENKNKLHKSMKRA